MRRALSLVAVLDAPGPGCALPSSDRICFGVECADNATRRLGPGQHHSTRCARDPIAPGFALGRGERRECARHDGCAELHEELVRCDPRQREPAVHCPENCPGFARIERSPDGRDD